MKATYANPQLTEVKQWPGYPTLVWSVTESHAESDEAHKVLAAAQKAQQHLDERPTALIFLFERDDDVVAYNHVPPKRVFSVKTQYKYIGKMKPRQFSLDE